MKTFLNVLYRRILYKIPLKFLLLLIAIFGILFACFSSADNNIVVITSNENIAGLGTKTFSYDVGNVLCITTSNSSCNNFTLSQGNLSTTGNPYEHYNNSNWNALCLNGFNGIPTIKNNTNTSCNINLIRFTNTDFMSSLQCQTEYNLIPISSVDQNYCTTNNLCPSCPVCPSVPVGTGGYSQLYINNILHLGAPNIIMNIPDEIDWDYAYTLGGQNMNIDVVGYNVDYEKIDSIVQFQNYKPSSEDFQRIISLLAPYAKIIVFFVFLFIVWAWIKKSFRSKKL